MGDNDLLLLEEVYAALSLLRGNANLALRLKQLIDRLKDGS